MNRQQAFALVNYINRSLSIIPTTGAEWTTLSGGLSTIESVANGLVTIEIKPIGAEATETAQDEATETAQDEPLAGGLAEG